MPPRGPRLGERRFRALGTDCHLLAVEGSGERLDVAVDHISTAHRRLTRFESESELSRLNAAAGGWHAISTDLEALLQAALRSWEETAGWVHAGVLPALLAAGYTRPLRLGAGLAHPPPEPPPPLPAMLSVRPGRARLRAGTALDLGGIAKGWLADELAGWLAPNCLVNLGGDLFARGGGPDDAGWPVRMAGVTLLLRDQGAATSSSQRRSWSSAGGPKHHLIDPRTGRPSESDLAEVSVVATCALEAEMWAKTGLLLGSERAPLVLIGRTLGFWLERKPRAVALSA
ncbi:MAG: FAD:protein FMN transferase [Candidatus Dormibacteraeota bacterium]|uniref:FAD:protein FMN transferase n=1 Tax=Candidatus Dormiibacter inghamiae TaxID=3127013 RepID=A0A934KHX6_9BACT|nr:FAD:protein FMN transferase [Candidatus Dormibacteraeota bacterium]MBJ7606059.1 FAD:protein FMN transferase [Candidatus Dormibacteraeota bacterium]